MWALLRHDEYRKDTAGWMANVPGHMRMNHLNIVGTHESLALHGMLSQGEEGSRLPKWVDNLMGPIGIGYGYIDNPRCQNRSPYDQLVDGVRYFDLRFDLFGDNNYLFACHGIADMGYAFTAFLQCLQMFLNRYPRETVIVKVKHERDTLGFHSAFHNDFDPFSHLFLTNNQGKARLADLTLDECRGKAILVMVGDPELGVGWREDAFWTKTWTDATFLETKGRTCRDYIRECKSSPWDDLTFQNYWADSSFRANPIDVVNSLHGDMVEAYKQENIGIDGQYRIGIQVFDFYEMIWNETLAIIRSNKGCANVQRN